jgi:hypothetical protein
MNGFPFNSAALNGGAALASIVYLPAATATVEIALNERIAVSMAGSLGMSISPSGDIYRVSNLGSAPFTFGISTTGDLTQSQRIYFEGSSTGFGLDASGAMSTVSLGPYGESSWGFAVAGDMDRRVMLSGSSAMYLSPTASIVAVRTLVGSTIATGFAATGTMQLTGGLQGASTITVASSGGLTVGRINNLPLASAGFALTNSGVLTNTVRMQGDAQCAFSLTGSVFGIKAISGTVTYQMTPSAFLSNNATGYDLGTYLMTRPATNREMTR